MKKIITKYSLYLLFVLVTLTVIFVVLNIKDGNNSPLITSTVETGTVRQLVSVSGITEARQSANLAFPVSGVVNEVPVKIGSEVQAGDVLVTLDTRALLADRQEAGAFLAEAIANRDELLKGPTLSARDVTAETLATKEASLKTTEENEQQKIQNAYQNLLSSNLTAYANDTDEDATPPTISGTYVCTTEGTYTITVFPSRAESGYSFNLSGIETGTFQASNKQPTPLGSCGLQVQFSNETSYTNSVWYVEIPNKRSSSYVTNHNAYTLAVTQAESAIALAEQAVTLAKADATNQNAPARVEAVARANAAVTQAQARLERIDSTIADRILTAPFAGTITEVAVLPGETVGTSPVVTLVANTDFTIIARVPEIDISELSLGQTARLFFDTKPDSPLFGTINYLAPTASTINGVAYFEIHLIPSDTPNWLRNGLSADVDIIITEITDTLRLPTRFISTTGADSFVMQALGDEIISTPITVEFTGNDGYSAITGLSKGDVVVAP